MLLLPLPPAPEGEAEGGSSGGGGPGGGGGGMSKSRAGLLPPALKPEMKAPGDPGEEALAAVAFGAGLPSTLPPGDATPPLSPPLLPPLLAFSCCFFWTAAHFSLAVIGGFAGDEPP